MNNSCEPLAVVHPFVRGDFRQPSLSWITRICEMSSDHSSLICQTLHLASLAELLPFGNNTCFLLICAHHNGDDTRPRKWTSSHSSRYSLGSSVRWASLIYSKTLFSHSLRPSMYSNVVQVDGATKENRILKNVLSQPLRCDWRVSIFSARWGPR